MALSSLKSLSNPYTALALVVLAILGLAVLFFLSYLTEALKDLH